MAVQSDEHERTLAFAEIALGQIKALKQPAIPRLQITLDGQPVSLPVKHGRSLQAIRAHLENIALKHQRVLFSLTINGTPVSLGESLLPFKTVHKIAARTISFNQLGFQLVAVAADQINSLHERVERLALQVMINEWPKAEALWWDLMPELKVPLLTLSFVPPGFAFEAWSVYAGVPVRRIGERNRKAVLEQAEHLRRQLAKLG